MLCTLRICLLVARALWPARCRHRDTPDYWREPNGTLFETCRACRTHWVTFAGGRRVRAAVGR